MPKAGVGIPIATVGTSVLFKFQSIYAQSGRWNKSSRQRTSSRFRVSIHLCPKRALEYTIMTAKNLPVSSFNPFMPKAGVGIRQAHADSAKIDSSFNPFMPKAGVGIAKAKQLSS